MEAQEEDNELDFRLGVDNRAVVPSFSFGSAVELDEPSRKGADDRDDRDEETQRDGGSFKARTDTLVIHDLSSRQELTQK